MRQEISGEISQLRSEMSQLRADFHGEMSQLRADFHSETSQLRAELQTNFRWLIGFVVGTWITIMLTLLFRP
ncbi:MAG: hypothetical protein ACE5MB_08325, partial [Anaerolineae bacterium]